MAWFLVVLIVTCGQELAQLHVHNIAPYIRAYYTEWQPALGKVTATTLQLGNPSGRFVSGDSFIAKAVFQVP